MDKRILTILGTIVLSSGILGWLMLSRGHDWGDDFAAYILQAQSLVTGRVAEYIQRSTFSIQASSYPYGPATVPWGLPLLLAPVYAIFGAKILAFKLVLTACYLGFLVAFFLLARTRLPDTEALLLTAVMAFDVNMLRVQNQILSDLPFLFLSTLGLWLIERQALRDPAGPAARRAGILIGLVICAATLMRPNGVLLCVPLAAAQFLSLHRSNLAGGPGSRAALSTAIPYLVFAASYGLQAAVLPSSGGGLLEQFSTLSLQTVLKNIGYYFLLPGDYLTHIVPGGTIIYLGLLVFFVISAVVFRRQDLPLLLYGLATLALFIVFPLVQGPRYIFPILPIFFLFAFQGMKWAVARLKAGYQRGGMTVVYALWAGLALVSLVAALGDARDNLAAGRATSSGPYSASSQAMFDYIRQATPADSLIIFFKPRAMRLLTDRDSFLTTNCADLPKADYVVSMKYGGTYNQISPHGIQNCNPSVTLTRVFGAGDFEIYRIVRRT